MSVKSVKSFQSEIKMQQLRVIRNSEKAVWGLCGFVCPPRESGIGGGGARGELKAPDPRMASLEGARNIFVFLLPFLLLLLLFYFLKYNIGNIFFKRKLIKSLCICCCFFFVFFCWVCKLESGKKYDIWKFENLWRWLGKGEPEPMGGYISMKHLK